MTDPEEELKTGRSEVRDKQLPKSPTTKLAAVEVHEEERPVRPAI